MKVSRFPKNISKLLAEEIGWHIGDGSMNYYKNKDRLLGIYQLRGHIKDDREHYINRIKPLFKKLYDLNISLREMPSTRVFGFQIWSNDLVKYKESLGLKAGPKVDIKIPENFLKDKSLVIAIIRGIFDTDGGIYLEKKNGKLYPRMWITTISKPLADQLKEQINNLGLRATLYQNSDKRGGKRKQAYVVILRGDEMFKKFMGIIKPKNPKHINKYLQYRKSFK